MAILRSPSAYRSIVILTGAGVSAESGIRTFRASDGLWEEHRVEDVATPEGFKANSSLVQRFYNERRKHLLSSEIQPNEGHVSLATLEREFEGDFLLVTQNIDDLHERAGSKKLIHMHGELLKMRCEFSGEIYPILGDLSSGVRCECCNKAGGLRPHIVWFGEMPLQMDQIYHAISRCDLFVAVGTSGHVYPAAGFVEQACQSGAHTIEINLEPSAVESKFDEHQYGEAGTVLPEFVGRFLAG